MDKAFGGDIGHFVEQRALLGTLDRILVERIRPQLGARMLEVGCGQGAMARFLLDRAELVLTDIEPENIAVVTREFAHLPFVRCLVSDITQRDPQLAASSFDSIVCSNVIEHIEDDRRALRNMGALLRPGGKLALIVPAHPWLRGSLDEAVGHYRRYTTQDLSSKLIEAGFTDIQIAFVNLFGTVGWWLNGKVLGRHTLGNWQLHVFDKVARPLAAVESWLSLPIGLSLVAVAERDNS